MRQRKVPHADAVVVSRPVLRKVAAVDIFPKPKEDFQREQTSAGAVVSAITISLIAFLVLWEGLGYVVGWNAYDTDLSIDNNTNRSMDVHIDITFPRNRCDHLSVDVRDVSQTRRINITRSLHKIPLTREGIQAFAGHLVSTDDEEEVLSGGKEEDHSECPRCFLSDDLLKVAHLMEDNGEHIDGRCCTTCEQVTLAYKAAHLKAPPLNEVPQCLGELFRSNPGCRVIGTLHLKKVSGSLVFAPRQANNVYRFDEILRFRSDHRINRLVIGNPKVARFSKQGTVSQLEGHEYHNDRALSEVKYFLRIVPTTYNTKERQSDNVRTYEYAAQWRARNVGQWMNVVPSVSFNFDFSPIQIDNFFVRPPLTRFLIKLCGIVGGLFVVLGVVDRAVARVIHFYRA